MIKHFCDRCGKEVHKLSDRVYLQPLDELHDTPEDMKPEYELCWDCKQELKKFLEGKK